MKTNLKLLLVSAALSALSGRAELIDVNFYSGGFGGSAASGAAVVGSASDQWNGFNGDFGGGAGSLFDASGNATGASLSFSNLSAVVSAAANIQPNASLMSQYIYSYPSLMGPTVVNITGLEPDTTYNMYVYLASNDASDGDRSAFVFAGGDSGIATGNPETTFIDGQNYLLLKAHTDLSGDISVVELPGPGNTAFGNEVDMNGFQLQVPDQATTFGMLALGVAVLLLLPKRIGAIR